MRREITEHNFIELLKEPLKHDDRVSFRGISVEGKPFVLSYKVKHNYLATRAFGEDNDIIFKQLGLKKDKYKLASKVYGYKVISGYWPSSVDYDYGALTKLVIVLFQRCLASYSRKKQLIPIESPS